MRKDYFNTFEEGDFCIHEDLEVSMDNQFLTGLFETQFDVDKKFGINVLEDDSAWVNLYTNYNPVTEDIEVLYYINSYDGDFEREYIPTEEEKKTFVSVMEQACIIQNKMNCREFYIREYADYIGEMSLVCEQAGDSCQIINIDDSFILYREDISDENLTNHLGHRIELANYGGDACLSIECMNCNEVLYSTDNEEIEINNEQEQKM